MKRKVLILIIAAFLIWNILTSVFFAVKSPSKESSKDVERLEDLDNLVEELKERALEQSIINDRLIKDVNHLIDLSKDIKKTNLKPPAHPPPPAKVEIPILIMACNRPTVKSIITKLLQLRPSRDFPIIVSQDCNHEITRSTIQLFKDQIIFIMQPDQSNFYLPQKQRHNQGYYKISRHYRWALGQVFSVFNYSAVVIIEDDLDVSDDFFEYFSATYHIMKADPTLWCVSAWNDNGKDEFIDIKSGDLLYRTDFFPGLGWMLLKDVWLQLAPNWPIAYWDDWMRHPDQRKGRSCIRPEISRTSTFGKIGVSKGQYFEKHLKYIKHYTGFVPFTKYDLSYLIKANYDTSFLRTVYNFPLLSYNNLDNPADIRVSIYRIEYKTLTEFVVIAKKLSIMEDLKSDIPRTGYTGIVSIVFQGHRVYICPPPPSQLVRENMPRDNTPKIT